MASRPAKFSVLIPYACPKCQYDVTRTLMDDITVCPECGGAVSEFMCEPKKRPMKARTVVGLFTTIAFGAYAIHAVWWLILMPNFGGGSLCLFCTRSVGGFAALGILIGANAIGCFLLWLSEERHRNLTGAAWRAALKTTVVFLGLAMVMGTCVGQLIRGMSV